MNIADLNLFTGATGEPATGAIEVCWIWIILGQHPINLICFHLVPYLFSDNLGTVFVFFKSWSMCDSYYLQIIST